MPRPIRKPNQFQQQASQFQAQLEAARRAFGAQDLEAKAQAEQDALDNQTRGQQNYINAIRTALLGRDENTKTLTAEQQRLTEQQFTAPTAERQRLIDSGITDPFERQSRIDKSIGSIQGNLAGVRSNLSNLKATREDLVSAGQTGYQTELDLRKDAAERLRAQAKERTGYATDLIKRQQALEDYEKQKQIDARYRPPTSGSLFDIGDALKSPLESFLRSGGKRVQNADGGFTFIDKTGKPITVEEATAMVPGSTKADLLAGSSNKTDQEAIQAAVSKPPTQSAKTADNNAQSGLRSLDKIETLFNEPSRGRTVGLSRLPFGFGDPKAQQYNAARKEITDIIARLRTGAVINEQEEKLYKTYVPGPSDSEANARWKIGQLKQFLSGLTLSGGGAPTADITVDAFPGYTP